ncbi:MAG TPA: penicillin-binding transpeptidase domain-containing protein [Ruminococcus sp.]|nr:penicillin-binding transpeptidase domain-containing protein [Ruminococcus sp.]
MKGITENIKSIIIVALVVVLAVLSAMRLMEIQVVGDEDIKTPSKYGPGTSVYTRSIKATRGEIMDYNGNIIVKNEARCDLVLRKAFFPEDLNEGNASLIGIYNALKERGYEVKETLPITKYKPYVFTTADPSELISGLKLNVYATAENCIDKLISDYEIADTYTDEEKRIIAGLRYEMIQQDFSYEFDMLLAKDVDEKTVVEMKELGNFYKGIEAVEAFDRHIERGDILPHEIGTVGPIYAEEYDSLKTLGYALNDQLGKSGIEKAMEKELRGTNGEEELIIKDGNLMDVKTITHTETGATVKLTVDGNFQLKLQGILENFLKNFPSINPKPGILDAKKGAIAVIDVKTGAVKGLATAPTYNLKDYSENYDYFLKAENAPLLNRATWGLYRPGSTFKTITATAGLNEGIITGNSTFYCGHDYKYHGGDYSCTGWHSNLSVRRAIEVSCNCFFYELSDRLGIDNITRYAKLYGLGSPTGIETGDAAGYLCNPETFAENGQPWYIGYVIQAGIGNQDCGMTPLQMAVVASTIANHGVRYKPYLVDSLYEYGSGELISKTQPTVAEKINLNYDDIYDYIIAGMMDAARNTPAAYSLTNLGYNVAIKTGTPQTGATLEKQNSFFIGFAPAEDPEVAFAGVIEDGEYSKYMIRDILLAYQECYGLNGVKPNIKPLPEEVRPVLSTTSSTETTTTTTTTTTASTTANGQTTASTAPVSQDYPVYTQPATVPPITTEPQTTPPTQPATIPPEPATPAPTTPPTAGDPPEPQPDPE